MNSDVSDLMAKSWRSLEAAHLLRDHGDHDFAASRAYYAMFYVAEALLLTLGLRFSSHAGVIGTYGKEFAKSEKLDPKFHRWIIEAEKSRSDGDYMARVVIEAEESAELCVWAAEFIQAAKVYLRESGDETLSP